MRAAALAALLLAGAACIPENGPLMAPGQDCLSCHDGDEAPGWTVAGTFPGRGRSVTIADANGKTFTLRTNQVGNFYTAEPLAFPLRVGVDGEAMPGPVTYGGCNLCHANGGKGEAPGALMTPGRDCLACHDGAIATRWTAAGTWTPPGSSVTIRDSAGKTVQLVTNEVGNFYTAEALAFPIRASVNGQTMSPDPSYGGCNGCHGGEGGDD